MYAITSATIYVLLEANNAIAVAYAVELPTTIVMLSLIKLKLFSRATTAPDSNVSVSLVICLDNVIDPDAVNRLTTDPPGVNDTVIVVILTTSLT